MRRVATSWKVIEKVLEEHAPSAYRALRGPAKAGDLTALEDALGRKLPAGLAASLRIHNGMTGREVLVDYMSLLSVKDIAASWRLGCWLRKPFDYGDQVSRTRKIKNDEWWRLAWIPFGETAGGDLLVADLDPTRTGTRGQVFRWYTNGATPRRVAAPSVAAWLDAVAAALSARRFTLDDLGTINLRKRGI